MQPYLVAMASLLLRTAPLNLLPLLPDRSATVIALSPTLHLQSSLWPPDCGSERGYYNPLEDVTSAGGCNACPLYATTPVPATTHITKCSCTMGFIPRFFNGVDKEDGFECICPRGKEKGANSDGIVMCKKCALGTYKETDGNTLCLVCPLQNSITQERGATDVEDCACVEGYFLGLPLEEPSWVNQSQHTLVTHGGKVCHSCETVEGYELGYEHPASVSTPLLAWLQISACARCFSRLPSILSINLRSIPSSSSGIQCNYSGIDLAYLPVASSFWRQSDSSRTARKCFSPGVCLGGTNLSTQCIEGHLGPYCGVCAGMPVTNP